MKRHFTKAFLCPSIHSQMSQDHWEGVTVLDWKYSCMHSFRWKMLRESVVNCVTQWTWTRQWMNWECALYMYHVTCKQKKFISECDLSNKTEVQEETLKNTIKKHSQLLWKEEGHLLGWYSTCLLYLFFQSDCTNFIFHILINDIPQFDKLHELIF